MYRRSLRNVLLHTAAFLVITQFSVGQEQFHAKNFPAKSSASHKTNSCLRGLDYTTSWIGNTYGGDATGPNMAMRHVELDMNGIYVTPDGRVFTNVGWDEGGRPVSVFKDGKLISPLNAEDNSPNWTAAGGPAIAASGNYIYAAQSTGLGNNPPCAAGGCGINIIDARTMINTGLSFGDSNLYWTGNIFGLAVAKGKLYVSEWDYNQVQVFDLQTLAPVASFPVQYPVKIAADSLGGIWISHRDPTPSPTTPAGNVYDANVHLGLPTVDHYDANGNWLNSITLPNGGEVGAISVTPWDALLVADNGPDLNIKIYGDILQNPVLIGTFGKKGGIYSGPVPGRVGQRRFRGMTGVGADKMGNIYVSQSGAGMDVPGGEGGHGVQLQSYSRWGGLNWEVYATDWISLGMPDPHDEDEFYDAYHHYKMDYSKPPGKEATYVADTYDRFLYPDDVRVTFTSTGNVISRGEIHYIAGHKFLFVLPQTSVFMEIYRFEPGKEIPIPCGAFDYGSGPNWQDFVVQPMDGEFIWRDMNGDGHIQANEFIEPANNSHTDGATFWVDTNGDIWQATYKSSFESPLHIRRYAFQGLDQFGAPIYDYAHMTTYNVPGDFPDFTQVSNMIFFPHESAGGTLYVWGQGVVNGVAGPVIARYDRWDKGNRQAAWVTGLPWNQGDWVPSGFTVAGGFVFVDYWAAHYNSVFDAKTGRWVGQFTPGRDVGGPVNVGNTDMSEPNFAYQRKNGEILLFQEEDFQSKILMYRWKHPESLPPPPPPPPPGKLLQTASDDEAMTVSWAPDTDPNVIGYTLSYSPTSGGPYTPFAAGITGPQNFYFTQNGTWYFVLDAMDNTGQVSSQSPEFPFSTISYGTTYEAENAVLAGGCIGTYSSPYNSNGWRVGCIDPSATITFNNVSAPATGTYAMRLYYNNGDDNTSDVWTMGAAVNGGAVQYVNTPYSGPNWNYPGFAVVNVQLNAGSNNTIVIENPISGGVDIDRIIIPSGPESASN